MSSFLQKLFGASWRTSTLGWLGLIIAISTGAKAFLESQPDEVDWTGIWQALVIVVPSLAALFARDNGVTSEESGAA